MEHDGEGWATGRDLSISSKHFQIRKTIGRLENRSNKPGSTGKIGDRRTSLRVFSITFADMIICRTHGTLPKIILHKMEFSPLFNMDIKHYFDEGDFQDALSELVTTQHCSVVQHSNLGRFLSSLLLHLLCFVLQCHLLPCHSYNVIPEIQYEVHGDQRSRGGDLRAGSYS